MRDHRLAVAASRARCECRTGSAAGHAPCSRHVNSQAQGLRTKRGFGAALGLLLLVSLWFTELDAKRPDAQRYGARRRARRWHRAKNLSCCTARPSVAGIGSMMACFWAFEVLHLSVTSLVPLAIFPMLGLASTEAMANQYMTNIVRARCGADRPRWLHAAVCRQGALFVGAFFISTAMEKWGLDRRIALAAMSRVGGRPRSLMLCVMSVTWIMSMFVYVGWRWS